MISTAGFFCNLPCPFRKSGLCERPHCHFSHLLTEPAGGSIRQTLSERRTGSSLTFDASLLSQSADKSYVPTPVNKLKQMQQKQKDAEAEKKKQKESQSKGKMLLPEYKPTPIHQLEKLKSARHPAPVSADGSGLKRQRSDVSQEKSQKKIRILDVDEVPKRNPCPPAVPGRKRSRSALSACGSSDSNDCFPISSDFPSAGESDAGDDHDPDDDEREDDDGRLSYSSPKQPAAHAVAATSSSVAASSGGTSAGVRDSADSCSSNRKRVAHLPSTSSISSSSTGSNNNNRPKVERKMNAKEVMLNRFKALGVEVPASSKSSAASLLPAMKSGTSDPSSSSISASRSGSKSDSNQKQNLKPQTLTKSSAVLTGSSSSVANLMIGKKRIAHTAKASSSSSSGSGGCGRGKRPLFPLDYTSVSTSSKKVPLTMRQQLLNKLIDEFLKVPDTSEEEAFESALKEEKAACDRAGSKQMYSMIAANTLIRIRSQINGPMKESMSKQTPEGNNILNHEAILNGRASNYTIIKREKISLQSIPDHLLYKILQRFVMTKDQLKSHGYPLLDPQNPGNVIIPSDDRVHTKSDFSSNSRTCARCRKTFKVNPKTGEPVKKETCIHHHGRIWTQKVQGSVTKIFSCCRSESSAAGCSSAEAHVVDGTTHPDYTKGFMTTRRKDIEEGKFGIFALDCEMCNTTVGMELTRVTVIDSKCETVFESLVKPDHVILDYNSKFSGIAPGDLDHVTTTLHHVQKKLNKLFNDRSILIGHSLDSDFKALKLIHGTVIDTACLFPHRKGLPFKRALRTIVAEVMSQIIQDSEAGHDSAEDAISCMKLVLLKAGEQVNKIKFKDPMLFQQLLQSSQKIGN